MTPEERESLITNNMKLVYDYVHSHEIHVNGFEQEDLFQEGMIALVKAANNFDISRGLKFSTYAVTCIRNHFGHLIEANSRKKRRGPDGNPVQIISLDAMNCYEDQI